MRPSISCAPLFLLIGLGVFAFHISSSYKSCLSFTLSAGLLNTLFLNCVLSFPLHTKAKIKMTRRLAVLPMIIAAMRPESRAVVWVPDFDPACAAELAGGSIVIMFS